MKKQILILSGPTHEYIDPVRFVGNASSGKMGKALAEEAVRCGFEVEFVSGPVAKENLPTNIRLHRVTSAEEMLQVAQSFFPDVDVIIFAAAVADYAPIKKSEQKITKSDDNLILQLRPTPDIAQTLCTQKRNNQIAIGFALQTEAGEIHARRKLKIKNLDGIILNTPTSLGAEKGTFTFLSAEITKFDNWGTLSKTACAVKLFEYLKQKI
jgi:phosphopantothenoylcysteine decarboxylase/phosphopantothenate--cysteine ligase